VPGHLARGADATIVAVSAYVVILRILHIGGGIFWAGTLLVLFGFLLPTARGLGPGAAPFMGKLMKEKRLPDIAGGAGAVTILSGVLLYWHDFGELVPFNAPMAGFAVGGVAAIALLIIGISSAAPANRRLAELGARAAQGEDVGAEIASTTAKRDRLIPLMTTLLVIAIVAMAIARYL
jgi:hypothetical protein